MKIEIGQIFTQIVSFLVMLWVMKRYAWKPLLDFLDARKEKIASEFEAIESQKGEIEKVAAEYRDKLKGIEDMALAKTKEAVEKGRQLASQIQEEAKDEAKALIAKAGEDLKKELLKAKALLKDEMVKITMGATEKLVKSSLTKEKQEGLVKEFIEENR